MKAENKKTSDHLIKAVEKFMEYRKYAPFICIRMVIFLVAVFTYTNRSTYFVNKKL